MDKFDSLNDVNVDDVRVQVMLSYSHMNGMKKWGKLIESMPTIYERNENSDIETGELNQIFRARNQSF